MRPLATIAAALLLAGCASDYGVTTVKLNVTNGEVTGFEWTDGKEKSAVEVAYATPNLVVTYKAMDVRAFDGQKLAVELHKALAEAGVKVSESVVRGAVSAVLGAAAGGMLLAPMP